MATKTYRTATGQQIDMQGLILKNEKVRAVGNMNVNARGDVIDSTNKSTSDRSAQVNKGYRKQTATVKDTPVVSSKKAKAEAEQIDEVPEDIITDLENAPAKVKPEAKVAKKESTGGLAGAIAKVQDDGNEEK